MRAIITDVSVELKSQLCPCIHTHTHTHTHTQNDYCTLVHTPRRVHNYAYRCHIDNNKNLLFHVAILTKKAKNIPHAEKKCQTSW